MFVLFSLNATNLIVSVEFISDDLVVVSGTFVSGVLVVTSGVVISGVTGLVIAPVLLSSVDKITNLASLIYPLLVSISIYRHQLLLSYF